MDVSHDRKGEEEGKEIKKRVVSGEHYGQLQTDLRENE